MRSKAIPFIVCMLFLFQWSSAQKPSSIGAYDQQVRQLDKLALHSLKKTILVSSWTIKGKKMLLTLYYKDSIPIKLEYPEYDVDGTHTTEVIYFDKTGKLYAGVLDMAMRKMVHVFPETHTSIIFDREPGDSLALVEQDKKTQKLTEQNYAYWTDLYMQFFPGFIYSYNVPATDAPPLLHVAGNSADLLDKPGGTVIARLRKGTYLNYLGRSGDQVKIGNKSYIYLRVQTEGKKTGWVWGNPDLINDQGEE
jgi:hypothetical protein